MPRSLMWSIGAYLGIEIEDSLDEYDACWKLAQTPLKTDDAETLDIMRRRQAASLALRRCLGRSVTCIARLQLDVTDWADKDKHPDRHSDRHLQRSSRQCNHITATISILKESNIVTHGTLCVTA